MTTRHYVVPVDQTAHRRQAQAQAGFARAAAAPEGIAGIGQELRRQAGAAVLHLEADALVARHDPDADLPARAIAQVFDRVAHQVRQQAGQHAARAADRR